MNLLSSIFGKDRRLQIQYEEAGLLGITTKGLLKVDVTKAEGHGFQAQATSHEVEEGMDVADAILNKGRTLTIEGLVSDDPINLLGSLIGGAAGALGSKIGGAAGAVTTGVTAKIGSALLSGSSKPSTDAFKILEKIHEDKLILTITTSMKVYNNMVMETLDVPRSSRNANALEFTAAFRQIKVVESELVPVPLLAFAPSVAASAMRKRKLGSKTPNLATGKSADQGSSLLASIAGI